MTTSTILGLTATNNQPIHVNASHHYFTRYLKGNNYNLYSTIWGRHRFRLVHYNYNYRNDMVNTFGTYWLHGHHYTRTNRNQRFFGYININGLAKKRYRFKAGRHYRYTTNYHVYKKAQRVAHHTKAHHYHIKYHGIDAGWTNNYHNYKTNMKALKKAVQFHNKNKAIQTIEQDNIPKSDKQLSNNQPVYKATKPAFDWSQVGNDIVKTVNQDRADHGISPVNDGRLNDIANERAHQIASNFSHTNENGNSMLDSDANQHNYNLGSTSGENIAYTEGYEFQSPMDVANEFNKQWYTDEKGATPDQDGGHRKNILDPNFTWIGTGVYHHGSNVYAVEDFANN